MNNLKRQKNYLNILYNIPCIIRFLCFIQEDFGSEMLIKDHHLGRLEDEIRNSKNDITAKEETIKTLELQLKEMEQDLASLKINLRESQSQVNEAKLLNDQIKGNKITK